MDEDEVTMVERVSRAIWNMNRPEGAPEYEDLDLIDQVKVAQIARACIKAMREPTEDMLQAAHEAGPGEDLIILYYQAMIDAALKED